MIKRKYGLQLFAEDGSTDSQSAADNERTEDAAAGADGDKNKGQEDKQDAKYTDADIDRIIGQKFAEWQKKKDKELSEAQKLAEMNAQEKAEYEKNQLQEELDELKAQNALAKMAKEARKMLSEAGIAVSDELLTVLVTADADDTKKAVESFRDMFKSAVQDAVKAALKGTAPKGGSSAKAITKDEIMAIRDPAERKRLIAENLELFQRKEKQI